MSAISFKTRNLGIGRSEQRQGEDVAYINLPRPAWFCFGIAAALSLLTANPVLSCASILLLPIVISLLWRSGEPPILLFIALFHWIEISTTVLYADWFGVNLVDIWEGVELRNAIGLSLFGLVALTLGMRLALRNKTTSMGDQAKSEGKKIPIGNLFATYWIAALVLSGLSAIAYRFPPIMQIVLVFSNLKWFFYFLLAFSVIQQRRGYGMLFTATTFEVIVGALGFFSGFKNAFFILLVVVSITKIRLTIGRVLAATGLFLVVLVFGIVWSAIKMEYRDFLNQGSGQQEVTVPVTDRLKKLADLTVSLGEEGIFKGSDTLIKRISYVEFFAYTLKNVPERVPFENGKLWFGAIEHVLKPRLFFPNKAAISDSSRTALYTGVDVSGDEEGTSISIGYMGESYIDFGPIGMFVPIFLLGLFYGFIYRHFVFNSQFKCFGFAIAGMILMFGAYNLESSNIKLLGGNVTAFLVLAPFEKFILPTFAGWLGLTSRKSRGASRPQNP